MTLSEEQRRKYNEWRRRKYHSDPQFKQKVLARNANYSRNHPALHKSKPCKACGGIKEPGQKIYCLKCSSADKKGISCCGFLAEHHMNFKDDPEHLTTDFIKKIIKCDCKGAAS